MANEFSSGFGQGLQSAQSDREYLMQKARYDAEAPMRAAQISLLGSQVRSANTRAVTEALAAENAVKAQESMAEALDFSSQIAGNYTPENEARLYGFVKQKPWLANTPWFTGMAKDFDTARTLQSREDLLTDRLNFERLNREKIIQSQMDIEKSKEAARTALEADKAKARADLEEEKSKGKKEPSASSKLVNERAGIAALMKEGYTYTQARKKYQSMSELEALPPEDPRKTLEAFYEARKSDPTLTYEQFTGEPRAAKPAAAPKGRTVVRRFDFTPTTK